MYTITCTDLKQVNSVSFNIKVNSVSFNGKDFPTNIPAKSSGWGGWVWDQAPPPPPPPSMHAICRLRIHENSIQGIICCAKTWTQSLASQRNTNFSDVTVLRHVVYIMVGIARRQIISKYKLYTLQVSVMHPCAIKFICTCSKIARLKPDWVLLF